MFTVKINEIAKQTIVLSQIVWFERYSSDLSDYVEVALAGQRTMTIDGAKYYDKLKQAMSDYLDGQHVDVTVKSKEN